MLPPAAPLAGEAFLANRLGVGVSGYLVGRCVAVRPPHYLLCLPRRSGVWRATSLRSYVRRRPLLVIALQFTKPPLPSELLKTGYG